MRLLSAFFFFLSRCKQNKIKLKDKGGKQHCLLFLGSNLGVEIFPEKREHQKRMR